MTTSPTLTPLVPPPEARTSILVASDDKFDELISRRLLNVVTKMWSNPIGAVVDTAELAFRYPLERARLAGTDPTTLSRDDRLALMLRMFTGDDVRMPRYTPEDAGRLFKFDVGHFPGNGAVYVQHPVQHDAYLVPATSNIRFAQERYLPSPNSRRRWARRRYGWSRVWFARRPSGVAHRCRFRTPRPRSEYARVLTTSPRTRRRFIRLTTSRQSLHTCPPTSNGGSTLTPCSARWHMIASKRNCGSRRSLLN